MNDKSLLSKGVTGGDSQGGLPMQRVQVGQRWSERIVSHMRDAARLSASLSDKDILLFEEKFLSAGFQFLRVPSIEQGRQLITTFLDTLLVYHEIACMAPHINQTNNNRIVDLYEQLAESGYMSTLNSALLDAFFVHNFYYDFVWIELEDYTTKQQWFLQFIERLEQHNKNAKIPILIVCLD